MTRARLAIAAGNQLGARAGAAVAAQGGNAVDACLAASVMACVAEPCFASLGGSAFVAVRTPEGSTEVIDGNVAMPSRVPAERGLGVTRVHFAYGGGMYTGIGPGSVGVPGALAAIHKAWERHGRIEWRALFADAIAAARAGIALPMTSHYFLKVTWDAIWARSPGARALFAPDGDLLDEGTLLRQPDLADTLEAIAEGGPEVMYGGDLGRDIAARIGEGAGLLDITDLAGYRAIVRDPVGGKAFGWTVESNPPPAVGGAVLIHMLGLMDASELDDPLDRLRAIVEAQRAAFGYRREHYQDPDGVASAFQRAVESLARRPLRSPATTHASTAGADGYVCGVTESNGYGSGIVVHGILLSNTLGEEELNPLGAHRVSPGSRCHSNMAPTIAIGPDATVALGSPGADRIVSAVSQVLLRIAVDGDSLIEAVSAPRAHLDSSSNGEVLCFEPGLPGDALGIDSYPYEQRHMYFGAVQAASLNSDGTVDAAHDPRRSGGSLLV